MNRKLHAMPKKAMGAGVANGEIFGTEDLKYEARKNIGNPDGCIVHEYEPRRKRMYRSYSRNFVPSRGSVEERRVFFLDEPLLVDEVLELVSRMKDDVIRSQRGKFLASLHEIENHPFHSFKKLRESLHDKPEELALINMVDAEKQIRIFKEGTRESEYSVYIAPVPSNKSSRTKSSESSGTLNKENFFSSKLLFEHGDVLSLFENKKNAQKAKLSLLMTSEEEDFEQVQEVFESIGRLLSEDRVELIEEFERFMTKQFRADAANIKKERADAKKELNACSHETNHLHDEFHLCIKCRVLFYEK